MSVDLADWRAQVRDWVTTEIGVYADLRLRGWSTCSLLPNGRMPVGWIRIQVDSDATGSRACGYVDSDESFIVYGANARAPATAKGQVLREFLHVLGFRGDVTRSIPSIDCVDSGDPGNQSVADGHSILNYDYCWGSGFDQVTGGVPVVLPRLSPRDILLLQEQYGRKPAGSLVDVNNRCLGADNPDAPAEPKAVKQLLTSSCDGGTNQAWRLSSDSGIFLSAYSNYNTLDVDGSVSADGRPVWNYLHNATVAQQWHILNARIVIFGSLCLQIPDTPSPLGAEVQIAVCSGAVNQAWHLASLGSSDALGNAYIRIYSAMTGGTSNYCLQATEGTTIDKSLIVQSCAATQDNQAFRFWDDGQIRTFRGQCIDVQGGRTYEGARVQVYDCWDDYYPGRFSQRWLVRSLIRSALGYCLDVESGSSYTDAAKAQIWTCNGGPTQSWDFWP